MTRKLIEDFTKIVKPYVQKKLLEENFEGMGEQDKAEFGRDFDEILSLAIKGLESSTWIPVTERLPEESDDYLITNIAGDVEMAYFAHPKDYAISKGEWREIYYEDNVIAWMPKPKPYKAESEDK